MLKMTFTVTYVSGEKTELTSRPATEVAFERRFNRTVMSLFADANIDENATAEATAAAVRQFLSSLQADFLYFLAWHSSRSEKQYDEWLELVDEIDWGFVGQADPTLPAPPAGT